MTFNEYLELNKKDPHAAESYVNRISDALKKTSIEDLTKAIKSYIAYAAVPKWAKEAFIKTPAIKYEIKENGYFGSLNIECDVKDPEDKEYDHFYINALVSLLGLTIKGGTNYKDLPDLIEIDIEDFIKNLSNGN